ncbi:MAG: hypothetical protein NC319_09450 [Butyricicoccus sp.]|nr:hypothetical protein [Butyricicoccus sp.]
MIRTLLKINISETSAIAPTMGAWRLFHIQEEYKNEKTLYHLCIYHRFCDTVGYTATTQQDCRENNLADRTTDCERGTD